MANNEDNKINYFFILPIIFLLIGFYILSGLGVKDEPRDGQAVVETDSSTFKTPLAIGAARADTVLVPCYAIMNDATNTGTEAEIADTPGSTDHAYQYFLLASIIGLVLLVLPRLKSLTISKDSVSIELLEELQKDVYEVQTVANKTQQSIAAGETVDKTDMAEKFHEIQTKIEIIRKMLRKRGS